MKTILVATIAALLAAGGGAYAGTSQIFGNGGKHYQFDAMCHRVTFVPPGISDHEAINVLGQQVYCLVRRPDHFAKCVDNNLKLPAAPVKREDHGAGKPADWTGVRGLYNYLVGISNCSQDHAG